MKCGLQIVIIGTIAMVIGEMAADNSLTSNTAASNRIIGRMKKELNILQNLVNAIIKGKCDKIVIQGPHGAVYTRWGHNRCPRTNTRLVYSGFVGGAQYSHSGWAVEYICLPRNPTRVTGQNKYSYFGYLYGAEYEFGRSYPQHDHDVPCAVCQSVSRPNSLMLPGRDICPKGWYREYKGQLMSGYHRHAAASQYACLDNARKTLPGGRENKDGILFYQVLAQCGSLKCPPYKHNQLLTCSVCWFVGFRA